MKANRELQDVLSEMDSLQARLDELQKELDSALVFAWKEIDALKGDKTKLEYLEISIRALFPLKRMDYRTIGDIAKLSLEEIRKTRGLGPELCCEVTNALIKYKNYGPSLNTPALQNVVKRVERAAKYQSNPIINEFVIMDKNGNYSPCLPEENEQTA